ncbi:hypothetical protein HP572_07690 [Pectobacterium sp. PL64]|uniref:hypothetical protein n=1 Tax=Pectobacterium sp. PL64 TaxID=2738983 RepID=UPI001F0C7977|nr:hypothetical protein [Pectobacterium sp. PL64]UMO89392.1 hypothetical protein HP572_07690 [Pectobacterium sp. PL64]
MTLKQMFSGQKAKSIDDFFNVGDKKKTTDEENYFLKLKQKKSNENCSQVK